MITQGPFSLALNQSLPLHDPGATSNNPSTAVQIQNASPFVIEVNMAGVNLTIQSFTAETLNITGTGGQTGTVTPVAASDQTTRTAPGTLTVVWLLAGESAPIADGPLTAAAIAALANTGIAGASSLFTQVFPGATHGTSTDFHSLLTPGTYRLWGWGWFPTSFAAPRPTTGVVQIEFGAGLAGAAWDQLAPAEGASNNINGLAFQISANFGLIVSNYFDQDVDLFANLSPA